MLANITEKCCEELVGRADDHVTYCFVWQEYEEAYQRLAGNYEDWTEILGIYDVFHISLGGIVFSSKKESEPGANLRTAQYEPSALGRALRSHRSQKTWS